jgi:hypothetical protein
MRYNKEDAKMTQGLAVLCMVVLHLFCRTGSDVLGTPLLWFDSVTPVVFWFGFFAEICVPVYSMCAGYAQQLLWQKGDHGIRSRGIRIMRLMRNYWIVLGLFAVLGLVFDHGNSVPGDIIRFLKSIVLLHSYNGAWWYLNTYVILLLIPPAVLFFPVHKLKLIPGLTLCGAVHVLWYIASRMHFVPDAPDSSVVLQFLHKEFVNLMGVLPYVWLGGFLCKYSVIEKTRDYYDRAVPAGAQKLLLLLIAVVLFVGANIVHKAVIMGFVAVFLLFNIWKKSDPIKKVMLFLGKHSTNIWLVHMFFYAGFLKMPVLSVQYPVFMLAALLALSFGSSYLIMLIDKGIDSVTKIATEHLRNSYEN